METGQFYTDNLLYSSLIFHESLGLPLKLLRSVKTEEDAPTHTIQYGLENEIKVKKEMMMIFLMLARFHDNIIQSSKNQ